LHLHLGIAQLLDDFARIPSSRFSRNVTSSIAASSCSTVTLATGRSPEIGNSCAPVGGDVDNRAASRKLASLDAAPTRSSIGGFTKRYHSLVDTLTGL